MTTPYLSEKTSLVDDARVLAVDLLPPPEQLIKFFPIAGGPVEQTVAGARERVQRMFGAMTPACWW